MTSKQAWTLALFMVLVHSGKCGEKPCDISDVMLPNGRLVTHAGCTHRNLIEIPMILPDSVVVLHLQSNGITQLGNDLSVYNRLEILNLACNEINNLTAQNFVNMSSLRELDVSGNAHLRIIDRDAFIHLPSLKILNMACDRFIGYLPVMKALAAAPFILDTLVIDAINKRHEFIVLRPEQFNSSSLSNLKRLSIRYNNIFSFDLRILQQMITIEHMNLGYNSPLSVTNDYDNEILLNNYVHKFLQTTNLVTLDLSNMYNQEWRLKYCRICSGKNIDFMDYFQWPRYHVSDIKLINNEMDSKVHHNCGFQDFLDGIINYMPPSLRFIYASEMLSFAKGRIYNGMNTCKNNIQHINLSRTNIGGFYGNIYGLENLEVLDFNRCEMFVLPNRFMTHFPKLRVLLMAHNNIPNITGVIGTLNNLEILDLSYNNVKNVPRDSFRGFIKLQNLDLSRNFLENVDFVVFDLISLSHLDLSFNNIHRLSDSFIEGLNELSRVTKFSISLQGNPLVCSCEFMTFVAWVQQILDSEHNIVLADGGSLDCLYLNETSYNISDVGYRQLQQVCSDRVKLKLVDNLLKTALIPAVTILLMCGLVASLCYILRHQIWWEWHVVLRGGKHVDLRSFTQHAFVACDDNEISKGFILHLEQSTGRRIDSSPYLNPNEPEMEQNGQRMESSKKVMFFVDLPFISNLNEWKLYVPYVVKSHYIKHIALVLNSDVMESGLRECRVLWRLSKLTQCFKGYYNGRDTNSEVFKRVQEFLEPDMTDDLEGQGDQEIATSIDEELANQNLQTTTSDNEELGDQNQQNSTSVNVEFGQQYLQYLNVDDEPVVSSVDGELTEQQLGPSDMQAGNEQALVDSRLHMSQEHRETNQQFVFAEDDGNQDILMDNTCDMIPLYPGC